MAKTYGIVSTKGGVGKTSLTANIGGILADMSQRVLLIDGDFQQSLSSYYKIHTRSDHGLRQFIMTANSQDCISKTSIDNLDIIISDDPNAEILEWFRASANNIYYLLAGVRRLSTDYDYILIDSQGARGILQESIILASDTLLCPLVPDLLESREFVRGTIQMLQALEPPVGLPVPVPNIPPMTGIIYRQDRTNNAIKIASSIRKQFYTESAGKISVLDTFVPQLSAYKNAVAAHLPVHRVEVTRPGPTPSAHDTILALVHELLPHLSDTLPVWENMPDNHADNITSIKKTAGGER